MQNKKRENLMKIEHFIKVEIHKIDDKSTATL